MYTSKQCTLKTHYDSWVVHQKMGKKEKRMGESSGTTDKSINTSTHE